MECRGLAPTFRKGISDLSQIRNKSEIVVARASALVNIIKLNKPRSDEVLVLESKLS